MCVLKKELSFCTYLSILLIWFRSSLMFNAFIWHIVSSLVLSYTPKTINKEQSGFVVSLWPWGLFIGLVCCDLSVY